jgi:hypothetical protein
MEKFAATEINVFWSSNLIMVYENTLIIRNFGLFGNKNHTEIRLLINILQFHEEAILLDFKNYNYHQDFCHLKIKNVNNHRTVLSLT